MSDKKARRLPLKLGPLAKKIEDQLEEAGFSCDEAQLEFFQWAADALYRLHLNGIIHQGELDRYMWRLLRDIYAAVSQEVSE